MYRSRDMSFIPFSLVAHIQHYKRVVLRVQLVDRYLFQVLRWQTRSLPCLHPTIQVTCYLVVADHGQLRGRLPQVAFILDHQQQAALQGNNEANAGSKGRTSQVDLQRSRNMTFSKLLR